jgi:DedD protein
METELKQRLIGASVIIALAVIFVPMLFDDSKVNQNQTLSIKIPDQPSDLKHKSIAIEPVNNQDTQSAEINSQTPDSNTTQDTALEIKPVVKKEEQIIDVVDNSLNDKKPESNQLNKTENKDEKPITKIEKKPEITETQPDIVSANSSGSEFGYRLQYGVFSQQKNAQQLKAKLLNKGYSAVVVKDLDKEVYKVYSEMLDSSSEAEKLSQKIVALKLSIGKPVIENLDEEAFNSLLDTGWIVQIGIYSNKKNSLAQRDEIRKSGFLCFVDEIIASGNNQYRVRVGPYATRDEAKDAEKQLLDKLKLKGLVKPHEKQKVISK